MFIRKTKENFREFLNIIRRNYSAYISSKYHQKEVSIFHDFTCSRR